MDFPFLPYSLQNRLKMLNVYRIIKRIAVAVPVKEDEGIRSIQRLCVYQTFLRRGEEPDPGILQQSLQPLLLHQAQGHCRFVPQGSAHVCTEQRPALIRQC